MLKWIKKKITKWVINDIKKEIPEIKEAVLEEYEEHKDELFLKCKEVIKQAIKDFVASKVNR